MRTIKYRQYLGNGNWHYWGYLEDGVFTHPLVSLETRSPSQQYTGLLDKNGAEIYEGDIVKYTASVVPLVEEVHEAVWYQAGFGFKKPGESGCATYLQTSKLEVIGNIHEHPHLLTNSI